MDPISQACFGASLSQSFADSKTRQFSVLIIGALAGMAPDLDVLINSTEDPLLFLEYHRQFSHSLAFIPIGALLCAFCFYPFINHRWIGKKSPAPELGFARIYLFSFLGYATHGLLDACTSYGTQLFWPFSDYRFAWNVVSIIDLLFTVPLLILIALAAFRNRRRYARYAFAYAVLYLSLGLVQYQRAENAIYQLAQQRGHDIERMHLKPSFANRHVWKLLYEYDGRYYVDAVKLLWDVNVIAGNSIQKLDVAGDFPWLPPDSQQAIDIERFRWFSDDFLAVSEDDSNLVMDIRYSFLPNNIRAMWGIEIDRETIEQGDLGSHVKYVMQRDLDQQTTDRFLEMLFE